jgi:Protein of unknown function (DUF3800)
MLVFIDESGDTGMKLASKSSSALFIVGLVLLEDKGLAQKAEDAINGLRVKLGLNAKFEFHFSKLKDEWRELFLREAAHLDFFYFAVVIEKAELAGKGLDKPTELYRYACQLVFECAKPYFSNATVVMDGTGSRPFQRELTSYLRKRINEGEEPRKIRKIKLQDSDDNNLLQLVDMVCGAVARSFTDRPDAQRYRKLISHREMDIQVWPRK